MSYLSLARKYRPKSFADLVGQESVGLALANAIRLKREPRGVIFTGVRGIGKTTTARIYAKALNCEKGPTPEPCNACASCLAIQHGTHEDVLEIDGASNTGVDDVRALQETLAYVPQRSSFKIYIIDEVHMLSVSAFNALLKTLEEPPEHVVFIFATTELHKVPETIQSRCQIFHLQKISTQASKRRLGDILNAEGIAFEERAVQWIAREGKGSLRDALTLLDQVIAVGGGNVSWAAVEPMVNTGHAEPIYEMLGFLLSRNSQGLLEAIARWDQEGLAMSILVEELVKACRNAFVLKSLPQGSSELELLDVEDRELDALRHLGKTAQALDLNRLFRSFVKCLDDLRNSELDRFVVENYALEWCLDPGLPDLTMLMQGGIQTTKASSGSTSLPTARTTAPTNAPVSQAPTQSSSAQEVTPKSTGPAMDLRNRWKQAAGSLTKAENTPQPAMVTTQTAKVDVPPTMLKASEASPALKPAFEAQARPIPETPTPISQDQMAAKAIVQNLAPQATPEPRSQAIAPKPASEVIALKSETASKSSFIPESTVKAPEFLESKTSYKVDDLPPWISEEETEENLVEDFEEFSIINQISEASTHKSSSSPKVSSPLPFDVKAVSALEPKEKLEAILNSPSPAPIAEASLATNTSAAPTTAAVPANWPASWKDFVDEWKKQKPLQARVLEETYAVEYAPTRIRLAVEAESLAGQKLLHIETRKKLAAQFETLFGFKGLFDVIPKSELTDLPQETLLETKQKVKAKERDDLRSLLENHPLTLEALSEFGGTIESIELQ